jgi:hypothetical protein
MNAHLRTENGRAWIEVTYDPSSLTWLEAVNAAVASYGLRPDQMAVIVAHPADSAGSNNNAA